MRWKFGSFSLQHLVSALTANRTISWPDASGTIALTSDLSSITVNTFAAAKALTAAQLTGVKKVQILGYNAPNDGGGGDFLVEAITINHTVSVNVWMTNLPNNFNAFGGIVANVGDIVRLTAQTTRPDINNGVYVLTAPPATTGALKKITDDGTVIVNNAFTHKLTRIIDSLVLRPEWWGIFPDNFATDYTYRFRDMGNFLRANDGCTVIFKPGNYKTQYIDVSNVRRATLEGNGAKFIQVNRSYPANRPIVQSSAIGFPAYTGEPIAGGYGSVLPTFADKIETVEVGAKTLKLLTPNSRNSNYATGTEVLLHGWDNQGYGYPCNARYFETAVVKSFDSVAGVITLNDPIQNRYDQNWPILPGWVWPMGQNTVTGVDVSYSPYEGSGMANDIQKSGLAKGIVYRDFDWSDCCCSWAAGRETYERCLMPPYVNFAVLADCEFIDCNLSSRYANYAENPLFAGFSDINQGFNNEIDKYVVSLSFKNCTIGSMTGSSSCNRLYFQDCLFTELANMSARFISFDNCVFLKTLSVPGFYKEYLEIKNCKSLVNQNFAAINTPITLGTVNGNEFVLPTTNGANTDFRAAINVGRKLFHSTKQSFLEVVNIVMSGANEVVQFKRHGSDAPATGDLYYFSSYGLFSQENNTGVNAQLYFVPDRRFETKTEKIEFFDFLPGNSPGEVIIPILGRIEQIKFKLTLPSVGNAGSIPFQLYRLVLDTGMLWPNYDYNATMSPAIRINSQIVGERIISTNGVQGMQPSDVFPSAITNVYCRHIRLEGPYHGLGDIPPAMVMEITYTPDPLASRTYVAPGIKPSSAIPALRIISQNGTTYELANPATASVWSIAGLCTKAATINDEIVAIREKTWTDSSWNWDTTKPIFLGSNGVLTQTAPTATGWSVVVARALSPTTIYVSIEVPTQIL